MQQVNNRHKVEH